MKEQTTTDMKKIKLLLIPGVVAGMLFSGCYYDIDEELYPTAGGCDTSAVTYSGVVKPILDDNCMSCHSAASAQGNVVLEGYANTKAYADAGSLIGTITHDPNFPAMPKSGNKLSDCKIAQIQTWINQGAPEN